MPSPFPGMDPYLENREFWSSVHSRLIIAIADALVEQLSEQYRIEVEQRTYYAAEPDDSLLVGVADVAILREEVSSTETNAATLTIPQPARVVVPATEEVRERYLEIREVATGAVVTMIELLSPKNKRAGEGRNAYERKRQRILASATHLVEIDLLRGGQPMTMAGAELQDYRILICRGDERPAGDLYAFGVSQPIPTVPIPLLPGDVQPMLDLQGLLEQVYQRGRYHLAIDYSKAPQVRWKDEAEVAWVQALVSVQ